MKRGIGLPILFVGVLLAVLAFVPAPILAQSPPDESLLSVTVTTDKQTFAPGEDIRIRVQITNNRNVAQTLRFNSGYTNDYVMNNAYRWSDGKGFTQALVGIPLAAGQTHVFPEFVHKASDYALDPGRRHEVRGEVVGYGVAVTTIFVSTTGTPSKLELTPIVRPNPAPFGAVINFAVSVRNVTNTPVTFGHSGCPVVFNIHGINLPPIPCPEYWKVVTLAPGQSIRFGPEEYPYLSLGHDRNAFFLPAGTHIVDFEVPGVGTTSARFQVLPRAGSAAISGQVVNADGSVVAGATIQAFTPGSNDSMPPPPNSAFATFQAYSGNTGHYQMDVPPGDYILRAFSSNSNEVWYNQVYTMDEATPVRASEGDVVSGIDFALKSQSEPPPLGFIFGVVHEVSAAPGDSAAPITDAVVAALPLFETYPDSGGPTDPPIVPGTGVWPLDGPRVYFGFTGENGAFQIQVPFGTYRVIAFTGRHRYQWWDGADLTSDADPYTVSPNARQAPLGFALSPIDVSVPARIAGVVHQLIPALHDVPPADGTGRLDHPDQILPLEGALLRARPLVHDPRILAPEIVYAATSGKDGSYAIDVRGTLPYIVDASFEGLQHQIYDHVQDPFSATPVDVFSGRTTPDINFELTPEPPPFMGSLFGRVLEAVAAPGDSAAPIADAVVAAFLVQGAVRDSGGPEVPGTGIYPTYPPDPWPGHPPVFFGFTDANGAFHISVPYGVYRVIAFTGGYRYQWWDGADLTSDADEYPVSPNARQAPLMFGLSPILLTVEARIEGLVNRVIPAVHDDVPRGGGTGTLEHPDQIIPLEGALVRAWPLVVDPRILTFREIVYETRSGADGTYALDVPGTVPCIVNASFEGHQTQFFDHAPDYFNAMPVDVHVGRTTRDINFNLYPEPPQPTFGVITGIITSDNGTDGPPRPIPGAIVRLRAAEDFPIPHEIAARTDEDGRYIFYGLPMASDGSHRYIVSAEAAGHVPGYYPGVYQWTTAQPVEPAPPEARTLTNLTLYQPPALTPWFTVGFVRARNVGGIPIDPPPPDDGDGGTGTGGDPSNGGGSSGPVPSGARILIDAAMAGVRDEGPQPLRGAYFYLVPGADAEAGLLAPMAGGVTTENGTVVLENVPPGVYRAYADRPGFELGWFGGNGPAGAGLISVGDGHAPVLADIVLNLKFPPPDNGDGDAKASVIRNLHNAPNPFRPETTIMYQLGVAADVTLKVFDVNGRLVRTLLDRASQFPGGQAVAWDGRDGAGAPAGAGIYFYRVETPFEATVGKMVRAR